MSPLVHALGARLRRGKALVERRAVAPFGVGDHDPVDRLGERGGSVADRLADANTSVKMASRPSTRPRSTRTPRSWPAPAARCRGPGAPAARPGSTRPAPIVVRPAAAPPGRPGSALSADPPAGPVRREQAVQGSPRLRLRGRRVQHGRLQPARPFGRRVWAATASSAAGPSPPHRPPRTGSRRPLRPGAPRRSGVWPSGAQRPPSPRLRPCRASTDSPTASPQCQRLADPVVVARLTNRCRQRPGP
jgi:hypothetical protein